MASASPPQRPSRRRAGSALARLAATRYDPFKLILEPVAHLCDFQIALLVNAELPASSGISPAAKKDPKFGHDASSAAGSLPHYVGATFSRTTGLEKAAATSLQRWPAARSPPRPRAAPAPTCPTRPRLRAAARGRRRAAACRAAGSTSRSCIDQVSAVRTVRARRHAQGPGRALRQAAIVAAPALILKERLENLGPEA